MLETIKALTTEYDMLPRGGTVLCAVSGGADSLSLLPRHYCLRRELHFTLCAAHYNHCLRGQKSDGDEEFVRTFLALCCSGEKILLPDGSVEELSPVEFFSWEEGLCVQCMHIGPYDDEPATVAAMEEYATAQGYEADFGEGRFHHEIYLSDVRRCKPELLKTVIRQPIKRAE